ncbi:MAG: carboxypeptidase-like regulatory domain-containing protein [Pyrinomonadaceae bacterium]
MKRFIVLIAVTALLALSAAAQLTTSRLVGTVTGPDGLVPGAKVVVKDVKTNKEVTVMADSEGKFTVGNLDVGTYTVTVTADGFKTSTTENVKIEIGSDYSLGVNLEVGGITEVVTVTAGADIINSTDAKISGTISRKALDDLPSLGRNPLNFVVLQPGAASNPSQNTVINGVRTSATNTTIDGVNVQDNFIRSNATDFIPARPTVDEVEEFAVSSQSSADDGFGGAQIQFTTRRGGNDFHVRAFEFNRNSALAANNFFSNLDNIERPFRNRNQFGGNVAGPILKDKLFFFTSYEKLIDKQPAAVQLSTTLTDSARQGIFTYTAAANDAPNGVTAGQIVSVNLLNAVFGTGITSINSIMQSRILSNLPNGNSTQRGDLRNTTGFAVIQRSDSEQTNWATRIDFNLNEKNAINGVVRYVRQDTLRPDIDNTFAVIPAATQPSVNPFVSVGWVFTPSARWSNEVRGGWFNSEPIFLRSNPAPSEYLTIPLVTNPELTFQNQGRIVDTMNIQDNANFYFGKHSFRFGGQFQSVKIDAFNDAGIVPTFTIGTGLNTPQITAAQFTNTNLFPGGVPSAQRGTANGLLALYGGIVSAGSRVFNVETIDSGFVDGATQRRKFDYEIFAYYFSDQWRVTNDLIVNIGLRYDRYTALRASEGLGFEPVISNLDDPISAILDPNGTYQLVGGNLGSPGQIYKSDTNNFAPVIGVAYSPSVTGGFLGMLLGDKKSVFRGGYRQSYVNDELVRAPDNALTGNQGLQLTVNAINPNTNTTALNARIDSLPGITTPTFSSTRTYAQNNLAAGRFGTVFAVDPKVQSPMVKEYSVGYTREIGWDTALEVRYVGTRSDNLLRGLDLNQVDIRNNGFAADFDRARSNLLLCQATAGCNTGGNFNPAVAGSVALSVFPNLGSAGLLTNGTVTGQLVNGTPADLAIIYIQNNLAGTVSFLANNNTGVADLIGNFGEFRYDSLQVDLRRRVGNGLLLNANYTFSKNLTNAQGTGQTRFEPQLDNLQPELERSRADYDQTHKFNFASAYELPFGEGKKFLNQGGVVNAIFGNWSLSGILQIGSGAPITITDARGTLNRVGRSARQTALTSLTNSELQNLVGVYRTPNGIFFLDPVVLGRNPDGSVNDAVGGTGRGANGFGTQAFTGQVFFNNAPGTTSPLGRAIFNGPTTTNVDLSLIKRFVLFEKYRFQLQGDMFNVFNAVNFVPAQFLDINSVNFGVISSSNSARVTQLAFRFEF